MKFSVPGLHLNPFEQHVVHQPRDLPPTVDTLNRETLEALVATCHRVEEAGRSELARLVLSPAPGFGKSHLIGRLFTELDDRATLVYLTPFETSTCWYGADNGHSAQTRPPRLLLA
jgi:DNA segregation ATPase FtsK/SpoIIIE, S-DNA-T family